MRSARREMDLWGTFKGYPPPSWLLRLGGGTVDGVESMESRESLSVRCPGAWGEASVRDMRLDSVLWDV